MGIVVDRTRFFMDVIYCTCTVDKLFSTARVCCMIIKILKLIKNKFWWSSFLQLLPTISVINSWGFRTKKIKSFSEELPELWWYIYNYTLHCNSTTTQLAYYLQYVSHVHITFSCFNVIFIFLLFHSLFPPFCPPPLYFLPMLTILTTFHSQLFDILSVSSIYSPQ